MFKILIMSDSHGSVKEMQFAIDIEKPDLVFFLGDGRRDIDHLIDVNKGIKVLSVKGNCDIFSDLPEYIDCNVQGIQVFATHGHHYEVKYEKRFSTLKREGKRYNADVILFGHTHEPYYEKEGNVIIMNPGTIGEGKTRTYGMLYINQGDISGDIKQFVQK